LLRLACVAARAGEDGKRDDGPSEGKGEPPIADDVLASQDADDRAPEGDRGHREGERDKHLVEL
jgi:hypothetical protein